MDSFRVVVTSMWDPDAGVFVATSEDVPGLVAEAATPTELDAKLRVLIPELLELNSRAPHPSGSLPDEICVVIRSEERSSKVRLHA